MSTNAILSPNDKHSQLNTLLQKIEPKLELVAPTGYDCKRFREVMLDLLMATPDLLKCAETAKGKMSFALACAHIAELGLDPSKIRKQVYVVPFMNRKDNYMEAVVIPDARGLIELMRRSGRFSGIAANVVYHGDEIDISYAPTPNVVHKPKLDRKIPAQFWPNEQEPQNACEFNMILGFYAMLSIEGEQAIVKWWTVDQVMKTKAQSRAGGSGPWVTHFVPMGIKTAVKDAARHAPLSPEVSDAIALDEELDSDMKVPVKADLSDVITIEATDLPVDQPSAPQQTKSATAKAKIAAKPAPAPAEAPVEPAPSPEPEAPPEPHNDIAEAQAKRKAEDDAQGQKNYEENIGKFNDVQNAIKTKDPNRVVMSDGQIVDSLDSLRGYYDISDARILYLKRLSNSQPGLTIQDFVNLFEFLKKTKGDVVASINEAHTARVGTWQALCEHFKYTPQEVVVEEEADEDRDTGPDEDAIRFDLEPIVAEEGFAPQVLEWLVENRADPSELVDYIVHLRAQGVDVAARLASHAESNLSMEQAHEEDGFDG